MGMLEEVRGSKRKYEDVGGSMGMLEEVWICRRKYGYV